MADSMRLLVHVEGQTEETFVNTVLAPHLLEAGYLRVSATLIGSPRSRARRGGTKPWQSVMDGILGHLKRDPDLILTTMVDYYGMPASGDAQWPGRAEANDKPFAAKADTVQQAIARDVGERMGGNFDPDRFIAYVSMHEFEALLFSDCEAFAQSMGAPAAAAALQAVVDSSVDPEQIDDSPESAPSKRILRLVPRYHKVAMGSAAIQRIGLDAIRSRCRNFDKWLARLEQAANPR